MADPLVLIGRDADHSLEQLVKIGRVGIADFVSDFMNLQVGGVGEQLLRPFDPDLDQIVGDGHAGLLLEKLA